MALAFELTPELEGRVIGPLVDHGQKLDQSTGFLVELGEQVQRRLDLLVEAVDDVLDARLILRIVPQLIAGLVSQSR